MALELKKVQLLLKGTFKDFQTPAHLEKQAFLFSWLIQITASPAILNIARNFFDVLNLLRMNSLIS